MLASWHKLSYSLEKMPNNLLITPRVFLLTDKLTKKEKIDGNTTSPSLVEVNN